MEKRRVEIRLRFYPLPEDLAQAISRMSWSTMTNTSHTISYSPVLCRTRAHSRNHVDVEGVIDSCKL